MFIRLGISSNVLDRQWDYGYSGDEYLDLSNHEARHEPDVASHTAIIVVTSAGST